MAYEIGERVEKNWVKSLKLNVVTTVFSDSSGNEDTDEHLTALKKELLSLPSGGSFTDCNMMKR
jgi:hypothetical protein